MLGGICWTGKARYFKIHYREFSFSNATLLTIYIVSYFDKLNIK